MRYIYFKKEHKGTAIIDGVVCKIKNDGSQIGYVNCKWCEFNKKIDYKLNYVACSSPKNPETGL